MKRIFDIPVYIVSKEEFEKRYNRQYEKYDADACSMIKQANYPNGLWRYNQIIGYISILVDVNRHDIVFEVYKSLGKYQVLSGTKRVIQNLLCNGLHFRYDNMTEEEIKERIDLMLESVVKEHFKNNSIDRELYDNTIGFIHIKEILEDK